MDFKQFIENGEIHLTKDMFELLKDSCKFNPSNIKHTDMDSRNGYISEFNGIPVYIKE